MTALQNIISRLGLGEAVAPEANANDRRSKPDRRANGPRDNVFLLHGTETRLQFAAKAIGFGTYDLDSASGEFRCSPELKDIAGLPPTDDPLSIEQIGNLIHPEDRERFIESFAAALDPHQKLSEFDGTFRVQRPDGDVRRVRIKGRSLFHGQGNTRQLLGATGVVIDITTPQVAEWTLEQQAHLLDLAPDPILAWDQRHGIVYWNKACETIFGYSRAEAIGKPAHELLKPEYPGSRQSCLADLARNGYWAGEVRYRARDGRMVTLESRLERLKHEGQVTVLESDRPLADNTAALVHSNEALARSNVELEHFAHVAAHDLQAPLRAITAYAQMLHRDCREQLDPRGLGWVERILHSAQRMQGLIRDILAYARLDTARRDFVPTDFNSLFDDMLATLDTAIQESGARVTRGDLPTVIGNPTQLSQVLHNLVGNAIKYRGDKHAVVHVDAVRHNGEWLFSVQDRGIGMAGEELERIFELFHRLHGQHEYPGSGIGLAVCRRFIKYHGGRIWAESVPGEGSTFYFTLPATA